jgi:ubiquitin thioesterase OTU1
MTRFGEGKGFSERMVLLYDGIHYDPLYLPLPAGDKLTVFPVSDLR